MDRRQARRRLAKPRAALSTGGWYVFVFRSPGTAVSLASVVVLGVCDQRRRMGGHEQRTKRREGRRCCCVTKRNLCLVLLPLYSRSVETHGESSGRCRRAGVYISTGE